MRVFLVYWHPEPQSFNAAMFRTAYESFTAAGNEVRTSDDPWSDVRLAFCFRRRPLDRVKGKLYCANRATYRPSPICRFGIRAGNPGLPWTSGG